MIIKTLPIFFSSGMVILILLLTGCSDRIDFVEQAMNQIRNETAPPIDLPPKTELIEGFIYSASMLRSPFLPPSLVKLKAPTVVIDNSIRPDTNRIKESLEQYDIAKLTFRGMIISPEGQKYALIQRPDNSIASVKVGNYIGLYDGRIVEIASTQIDFIEILPSSGAGFVESSQSLISPIS